MLCTANSEMGTEQVLVVEAAINSLNGEGVVAYRMWNHLEEQQVLVFKMHLADRYTGNMFS